MPGRLRRSLAFLHASYRTGGLRYAAREARRRVSAFFFLRRLPVHPFDVRHGVDTSGFLVPAKITAGQASDGSNAGYLGTHPSLFLSTMQHWVGSLAGGPHPLEEYTFIDIGCGKGRVLMLASDFAFRSVTGVELSPALATIARVNLQTWQAVPHACGDLRVVQGDVLEFVLPEGPLLLYLFHPFDEALLQRWLSHVAAAARTRSTPIDLMYVAPLHDDCVRRMPEAQLLWEGKVEYSAEDALVDAMRCTAQFCTLYRLRRTT